jgi:hypothetical protein
MGKKFFLYSFIFIIVMSLTTCSNLEPENIETLVENAENNVEEAVLSFESQSTQYRSLVFSTEEASDCILEAYQNSVFRDKVIVFFGTIIGSNELAALILKEASERDISPAIVFALSWEESRFNQKAVNRNVNNSIDRGLFQLNSSSFPNLKEADFFDPKINTQNAMAHLRWCLDYANSEVAGLAMYNAGSNRVRNGATPKKTLDYVSRIMRASDKIEELFLDEMNVWTLAVIAEAEAAAKEQEEPAPINFVPVDSLALAWAGILSTAP